MKTVLVTGNTYPVKDALKALGGKWDASAKGWRIPEDKAEEAKALVAGSASAVYKKQGTKRTGPTKRCWECGCSFTEAEARQYGGDWADGYCGC